ncbi:MAG: DUF2829 domain-containing protein [Bacteroidales bacterium]|nr:DUF2829 domain-containing protein [Bacteroidales bacterium]MDO4213174.1 DUF2829 domain-containing protein [Bacteroidales bacterium]
MKFSEIIDGLKEGRCYTRFQTPAYHGKLICRQVPNTISPEVVQKASSIPQDLKVLLSTIGLEDEMKGHLEYHDQILIVTCNDHERLSATSWNPSAEDIFAEDWATA